ncbi:MAG: MFS transporter [Alphaproteobacteria bacterium]|nr:MFS transporter [Alphaproteobacteria bacterium]
MDDLHLEESPARKTPAKKSPTINFPARKSQIGWALYDWASSPVPTLHATFIFAVYFTTVIMPEGGSVVWAYMTGITAFTIALIAPLLGSYADSTGKFKELIVLFIALGSIATGLLWFAQPNEAFISYAIILSAISIFFLESSFIFYNAILGKMIQRDHIGSLSGLAWGGGYIGSVIALIVVLVVFIMPDKSLFALDKSQSEHIRATMLFAASWAIIFSLPMMFYLPSFSQKNNKNNKNSAILSLKTSIIEARKIPNLLRFLLARMAYNDGLITLFAFGGIYATKVFSFSQFEIILFAIGLNISAGIGAIIGGFLDDNIGPIKTIKVALIGLFLCGLVAIITPYKIIFWIVGVGLGLFVGPVQSASRTYLSLAASDKHKGGLFGLYMVSGKLTSFIGPFLYGSLVMMSGNERYGMAVVLLLIAFGFVLLPLKDNTRKMCHHSS